MEPWHVSRTTYWAQDNLSEHDRCLARIHMMEHELGMNPEYSKHCELCVSKSIDSLWNKVASRYDPSIEGRLRR
jgi:hypothetical protein